MTVERIFTCREKGAPQAEHRRIRVVVGGGLEADRYFGRRDEPGQNLTLIEAEAIETFLERHGRPHDLSVTRRNLVTRGVRLNDLVGRDFFIGAVRLRGVELCEPCLTLGKRLQSETVPPAAVIKQFLHRGGLRADVLSTGEIAVGASITLPGVDAAAQ